MTIKKLTERVRKRLFVEKPKSSLSILYVDSDQESREWMLNFFNGSKGISNGCREKMDLTSMGNSQFVGEFENMVWDDYDLVLIHGIFPASIHERLASLNLNKIPVIYNSWIYPTDRVTKFVDGNYAFGKPSPEHFQNMGYISALERFVQEYKTSLTQ